MKKRLVIAPVAIAALVAGGAVAMAATGQEEEPQQTTLRVATYNVQHGVGIDEEYDVDRTAAVIDSMDADIVALQEVDGHFSERSDWEHVGEELAERLDMYHSWGPIYSNEPPEDRDERREYGNALLSKYPFIEEQNHEITRLSTQEEDPVPEPAPGFPEIRVDVDGIELQVFSTHLESSEVEVREMQIDDMLGIMDTEDASPQILMGDFNMRPENPEGAPLWDYMNDAWAEANGDADGFTFRSDDPDRRIDYLAVTDEITVNSAEVIDTQASDHMPVVMEITLG